MNIGEDVNGHVPGVIPTFGRLSLGEAEALLNGGLLGVNLYQLRGGVPGISEALFSGQVVYNGYDPQEHFASIREIWEKGGNPPPAVLEYRRREGLGELPPVVGATGVGYGDCEDIATAVAAERTHLGQPSKAAIQKIRPGLAHVVVQDRQTGRLEDPCITGGMGRP